MNKKKSLVLMLTILSTFSFIAPGYIYYTSTGKSVTHLLLPVFILLSASIIIFILLIKNNEYYDKSKYMSSIQNATPAIQYIKSIQHDYKNLVFLNKRQSSSSNDIFSGISESWLGSFFYTKCEIAKQKGVNFKVNQPFIIKYIPLKDYDILRVFGNLIDNAIECTHKGNTIYVSFDENECEYIYSVSNNGDTLNLNQLERIFESGITSKGHTDRGYGLFNTYNIINKNKGKIVIDLLDDITTFNIIFNKINQSRVKVK